MPTKRHEDTKKEMMEGGWAARSSRSSILYLPSSFFAFVPLRVPSWADLLLPLGVVLCTTEEVNAGLDAALGGGPIPNGAYRCRVIKVGAKSQGMLDYVAYPAFTCSIAAQRDLQQLAKLNGSQRQFGLIFPGDLLRQVFLGTLVLGDETRALQYGQDDSRDVVGYVERIGPNRWRLVMPSPHFESQLDVMELVPAG